MCTVNIVTHYLVYQIKYKNQNISIISSIYEAIVINIKHEVMIYGFDEGRDCYFGADFLFNKDIPAYSFEEISRKEFKVACLAMQDERIKNRDHLDGLNFSMFNGSKYILDKDKIIYAINNFLSSTAPLEFCQVLIDEIKSKNLNYTLFYGMSCYEKMVESIIAYGKIEYCHFHQSNTLLMHSLFIGMLIKMLSANNELIEKSKLFSLMCHKYKNTCLKDYIRGDGKTIEKYKENLECIKSIEMDLLNNLQKIM